MTDYVLRRIRSAILCCLLAFFACGSAHAFLGLFYAEAKIKTHSEIIAGLDEPTRRVIEGMPENIRKEFVETLRQSLPLINKSLAEFLQDVDQRLEKRINQLVCSGQALGQGAAEEIRGVLMRERPTPVRDLLDGYFKRGKKFDGDSALQLAVSYEDFLQQAAITACRLADDAGLHRVNEVRIDAREFWRTWVEIEKKCTKPSECLSKRYRVIEALISNADQRDVEAANAKKSFSEVSLKPSGTGGSNILSWLPSGKTEWIAYETELLKLRTIERTMSAAQGLRETVAKRYLTDATVSILDVEQALVRARARLSNSVAAENNAAHADAVAAIAARVAIVEQANQAVIGDPRLRDQATALLARLKVAEAGSADLTRSADSRNKDIADRATEQKRLAEERAARIAEMFGACRGSRVRDCVR